MTERLEWDHRQKTANMSPGEVRRLMSCNKTSETFLRNRVVKSAAQSVMSVTH